MEASHSTAILFFTRSPRREALAKRWTSNVQTDLIIARTMYRNSRRQLEKSSFPVYEIGDNIQRGDTFGERFANAIEDVFQLGYEHLIAVGSDLPGLGSIPWEQVNSLLQEGKTVLGPDQRGGIYLMGISKDRFYQSDLKAAPWQTSRLFAYLVSTLEASVYLPSQVDLNSVRDIFILFRQGTSTKMAGVLLMFLRICYQCAENSILKRIQFVQNSDGRAPPRLVIS